MGTESNKSSDDLETDVVEGGGFGDEREVAWETLSEFRVQIHKQSNVTAEIFANGLQQAPIEVVVEARNKAGAVVQLSREQLFGVNGVRLIHYENNGAVRGARHTKDTRFVYEWPLVREDGTEVPNNTDQDVEPESNGQVVPIFVTKADLDTTWIAAEFKSPSGAVFRTNTPETAPGKFDSWVKLRGRQPEVVKWDKFIMFGENAHNAPYWDVDLYYIRFEDPNLKIVASRHYGLNGHDSAHYAWMKDGNHIRHVCYEAGGERVLRHYSMAGSNYIDVRINKHSGQATASRISDARDYDNISYQGCVMGYISQHGNESKVFVRGHSNGNTLYLDDPGSKGEEQPPVDSGLPAGDAVAD